MLKYKNYPMCQGIVFSSARVITLVQRARSFSFVFRFSFSPARGGGWLLGFAICVQFCIQIVDLIFCSLIWTSLWMMGLWKIMLSHSYLMKMQTLGIVELADVLMSAKVQRILPFGLVDASCLIV